LHQTALRPKVRIDLLAESILPAPPATVALAVSQIVENAAVRRWRVYIYTGFGLTNIVAVCKTFATCPVAVEVRTGPGNEAGRILIVNPAIAIVVNPVATDFHVRAGGGLAGRIGIIGQTVAIIIDAVATDLHVRAGGGLAGRIGIIGQTIAIVVKPVATDLGYGVAGAEVTRPIGQIALHFFRKYATVAEVA